jgi:hypothetical protein
VSVAFGVDSLHQFSSMRHNAGSANHGLAFRLAPAEPPTDRRPLAGDDDLLDVELRSRGGREPPPQRQASFTTNMV